MNAIEKSSLCCMVVVGTLLIGIVSCAPRTQSSGPAESQYGLDPVLYVDRRTGCHYLGPQGDGGLTPRMMDGKQICEVVK